MTLYTLDIDTLKAYEAMTKEEADRRDEEIYKLCDMERGPAQVRRAAFMAFSHDMIHPEQWTVEQ